MDASRATYWAARLRPIRLGAEPVEAQLSRRFAGMVVISAVTGAIGLMILAIFAAFGRADVGLEILGLAFLPATLWFWIDYAGLRRRVSAYLRERDPGGPGATPPG